MMTLDDLMRIAAAGGSQGLRCRLLLWKFDKPSYDQWADLVEDAISCNIETLSRKSHLLQGLTEDQLTAYLIASIEGLGLTANSRVVNGNCDVVVSFDGDYFWIGEAKIFNGVSSIWQGYLQLTTRYAVSTPGSGRGGMLIYCFISDAAQQRDKWRAYLLDNASDCSVQASAHPLVFVSDSTCISSGLPFRISHFVFPLFHEPQDRSGKASKRRRVA